ncbi:MAG: NUDIX hydrolase, partial [Bacillota bacterium]
MRNSSDQIPPFHIDLTGVHKHLTPNLTRTAARAILYNDKGSLLMLLSNKGDYKFPGGGLEESETCEVALKREVKEETGYTIEVGKHVGSAMERRRDFYDPGLVFEMVSHYYACTPKGKAETPELSGYETTLNLKAVWVHP